MDLWRCLNGMVKLNITTADPVQFLSNLQAEQIPLEQVIFIDELTILLQARRQYVRKIKALAIRKGSESRIVESTGL